MRILLFSSLGACPLCWISRLHIPNLNNCPFWFLSHLPLLIFSSHSSYSYHTITNNHYPSLLFSSLLWHSLQLSLFPTPLYCPFSCDQRKMGEIAFSNGIANGINGVNEKSHTLNGYRKSCWYEEEIEENIRWCFALNRYILYYIILMLIIYNIANFLHLMQSSVTWMRN